MPGELIIVVPAAAISAFCAVGWAEARAHYRRIARDTHRLRETIAQKNSEIIALQRKLSAGGRATAAKRRARRAEMTERLQHELSTRP